MKSNNKPKQGAGSRPAIAAQPKTQSQRQVAHATQRTATPKAAKFHSPLVPPQPLAPQALPMNPETDHPSTRVKMEKLDKYVKEKMKLSLMARGIFDVTYQEQCQMQQYIVEKLFVDMGQIIKE
ncbi:hypothetical protein FGO68_gene15603 [Halteria grandinella]|uniref:Uncharacterized protein n=1 Tax=Halteria grandinella TaxID=5974 RepID=A0A8J8P1V9_HALGN|nr:hypothetical protein FGO68_gene15603 [Halteria grandinella]